jgi:hypothetical protein
MGQPGMDSSTTDTRFALLRFLDTKTVRLTALALSVLGVTLTLPLEGARAQVSLPPGNGMPGFNAPSGNAPSGNGGLQGRQVVEEMLEDLQKERAQDALKNLEEAEQKTSFGSGLGSPQAPSIGGGRGIVNLPLQPITGK